MGRTNYLAAKWFSNFLFLIFFNWAGGVVSQVLCPVSPSKVASQILNHLISSDDVHSDFPFLYRKVLGLGGFSSFTPNVLTKMPPLTFPNAGKK